jgi:serine protease Do
LSKREQSNQIVQPISNEEAVVKVVKQVSPSVVSIIVTKDLPIMEKYYYNPFEDFEKYFGKGFGIQIPGYRQKGTEKKEVGGGTGFIVSSNGLILTNKHVVLDEQAEHSVLMNDGRRFDAKVIARDPVQDIAILKINDSGFLPAVKLGNSDQLEIGQTVIAIGNVLGEFRNSVSVGVISGLQRSITASGLGMSEVLEDTIQTDAAINKGNSGGPLLNIRGEVIGINTATALQAQNVGFAIPINKAKKDIYQVQEFGEIRYPFLGIYYTLVTPALQQEFGLGVDYGAWIGRDQSGQRTDQAVFPDSPAEKIGLQRDDIILEFNGEKISLDNSLAKVIMKYNPGDKVVLKVLRQGETKTFNVVLDKRSE